MATTHNTDWLSDLADNERTAQCSRLNLIASENYASPKTAGLLSSAFGIKYGEGYPGKRYYAGNEQTDELERRTIDLALRAFRADGYGVNVQVLSGTPANQMVYLNALEPGDKVMSLSLAGGGHISHLHDTSAWRKILEPAHYELVHTLDGYRLDLDAFEASLKAERPRLVIIGFSAYPPQYKFEAMTRLAHAHGALVLADIAHIAGLVASERHDSPFKPGEAGADFVTMTTHKTLRGPRGALLFAKDEHMTTLNRTVFPGASGGPHFHTMAGVAQALREVVGDDMYPDGLPFGNYIEAVLANCAELELGLADAGVEIVTPTGTHLTLARIPDGADSLELQQRLERLGIITNRNTVPGQPASATPMRPGGIRFGTAALTSRGLTRGHAYDLGHLIGEIMRAKDETRYSDFRFRINEFVSRLNWYS